MKTPISHRRSGSGPTGGTDAPSTVMTRLVEKKTRPGRSVVRRLRRKNGWFARKRRASVDIKGNRLPNPGTRVNPARDHHSRKSGRLRKELQ